MVTPRRRVLADFGSALGDCERLGWLYASRVRQRSDRSGSKNSRVERPLSSRKLSAAVT